MADKSVRVEVIGLAALQRALRQASDELPDAMAGHLMTLAEDVASKVRSVFPSASQASTIVARAQKRGATISLGGHQADYGPWLDMGGTVGRGHKRGPNMGAIHRDWMGKDVKKPAGRYMFPTVSAAREETLQEMDAAIAEVIREAGF